MNDLLAKLRPERSELIDGGFTLLLLWMALWAFRSSFGGTQFIVLGAIATLVGVIVAHVTMRFAVPIVLSVVIWLVVYVFVGGVLAARSQAIAGVLPSPGTVTAATRTMVRGWKELLTTVPPVGRTGDLLVLPVFCGIMAGAATCSVARKREWVGGPAIPALLVLALGILCGTKEPVSVLLHGGAIALVVLVWSAMRNERRRPNLDSGTMRLRRLASAGAVLGVATFAGLSVGGSLPMLDASDRTVWRDTFEPPFDPSVFPSPLGYYRQFVKELKDTPMFEVQGLPDGVPIRLATLDDYDGIVWKATGGTSARINSAGYFQRVGTDVDPEFPKPEEEEVTITFPVDSEFGEVWIPTVGEVRSIDFDGANGRGRDLADNYRYNRTTDTGAMLGNAAAGDSYEMSVTTQIGWDDLPEDAQFGANNFEAIDAVPPEVSGLGSGFVEDVEGIERVTILRDLLRGEGDGGRSYYSSSEDGQSPVPPGHGAGRLVRFAGSSEQVGNAEQYAATLGLILRNDGIPARVVMGFEPKEWDPDGSVLITGEDAEAWVEVLIEDIGWVQVSPTPDRSKTTVVKDDSPKPIPDRETQVPPPPPIIEPDAETDPASESEQTDREEEEEEEEEEQEENTGGPSLLVVAGLIAAGLPIAVFLIVLAVILLMKNRRRRRRLTRGRSDEKVANGWRELVDYAVDSGRPVPLATTRREAAGLFTAENAESLALQADAVIFGPEETIDDRVVDFWDEVGAARKGMRQDLGVVDRVKAAMSLDSFRRAKQQRRAEQRRVRLREREEARKKALVDA
jgi:hypothetical protein